MCMNWTLRTQGGVCTWSIIYPTVSAGIGRDGFHCLKVWTGLAWLRQSSVLMQQVPTSSTNHRKQRTEAAEARPMKWKLEELKFKHQTLTTFLFHPHWTDEETCLNFLLWGFLWFLCTNVPLNQYNWIWISPKTSWCNTLTEHKQLHAQHATVDTQQQQNKAAKEQVEDNLKDVFLLKKWIKMSETIIMFKKTLIEQAQIWQGIVISWMKHPFTR